MILIGGVSSLAVVGVALYAVFALSPAPVAPAPEPATTVYEPTPVTLVGEVTEVNFEQVAFDGPSLIRLKAAGTGEMYVVSVLSMGLSACAAYAAIADPFQLAPGDRLEVRGLKLESGKVVPCEQSDHYLRATRTETKDAVGLAYTYKKGPQGYVLEENTLTANDPMLEMVYTAVFTNTEAYADFVNATDAREGPENYSLRVYRNAEKLWPAQWVEAYPDESNVALALEEPVELAVAGAKAVRYTVDGLYPIDTYVVTQGAFTYLLSGMFNDATSVIGTDYARFIETLKFVPAVE